MAKVYVCSVCGYSYDESVGDESNDIKAGTPFDKLPSDWVCPVCGVDTTNFNEI